MPPNFYDDIESVANAVNNERPIVTEPYFG